MRKSCKYLIKFFGFFMRTRYFFKHAFFAFLSIMFTGAIGLAVLLVYFELQLPDVSTLKDLNWQLPLKIFTKDNVLIGEFGPERRTPVTINQVPKQLINAVLATEDQRFFEHSGIDPIGIGRAFVELIATGKKLQGGSTITMQVARNYFLSNEKTYGRKLREILLAIKIDQTFSKDKILEFYLNKIYFGNKAYGVSAAAQVYFGKTLNQLTLPEMATIAGIPKAPSQLNPIIDPEASKQRRDHVLQRMYELGYISKSDYSSAIATPVIASYHGSMIDNDAPYVAEMVRDAIYAHFGDGAYRDGFTIYTTIDSKLQKTADHALENAVLAYDSRHHLKPTGKNHAEGAIVAVNPQSGAVLALDGGFDYNTSNFNRVTQAQRQPGSSFKPFIYAAALAKGYTLATLLDDSPIQTYDPATGGYWKPQNDDHNFYGPTRLREALVKSLNLASIHLLQSIGIDYSINYATRFGFDRSQLPRNLTMALGTGVVTPLQMASAYSIFANGGYKITPYLIDKIVDSNGKVIYQAQPKYACEKCIAPDHSTIAVPPSNQLAPQVITPQIAFLMTSAMQGVIREGTASKAEALGRSDLAGKTGSMDADAWFTGFNSDLVVSTWVGFDNPTPIYEYGSRAALPMWMDFMRTALAQKPLHTLPVPPGIISAKVDRQSGQILSKDSQGLIEWFDQNHLTSPTNDTNTPNNNAAQANVTQGDEDRGPPVIDGTKQSIPVQDTETNGADPLF